MMMMMKLTGTTRFDLLDHVEDLGNFLAQTAVSFDCLGLEA